MRALAILALWCALLPAAAVAQQSYTEMEMQQRHLAGREPLVDPARTHAFALCVSGDPYSRRLLGERPYSGEENEVVFDIRHDMEHCHQRNRPRLLVGVRFLRGAAAESLLEQRGGVRPRRTFPMPSNEALERLSADARAAVIFIQIGECAARANLQGVMDLLASEVGTARERAAVSAMLPSVAACVPAGISFQMPPLQMRAYLAEGAYRNAAADRAGRQANAE
ncbi:MAG: hypothetical protein QOC65_117 [Sphingomonadales bacterium]|nr:hypothetical protein [Sphingomonadales bacterium]